MNVRSVQSAANVCTSSLANPDGTRSTLRNSNCINPTRPGSRFSPISSTAIETSSSGKEYSRFLISPHLAQSGGVVLEPGTALGGLASAGRRSSPAVQQQSFSPCRRGSRCCAVVLAFCVSSEDCFRLLTFSLSLRRRLGVADQFLLFHRITGGLGEARKKDQQKLGPLGGLWRSEASKSKAERHHGSQH